MSDVDDEKDRNTERDDRPVGGRLRFERKRGGGGGGDGRTAGDEQNAAPEVGATIEADAGDENDAALALSELSPRKVSRMKQKASTVERPRPKRIRNALDKGKQPLSANARTRVGASTSTTFAMAEETPMRKRTAGGVRRNDAATNRKGKAVGAARDDDDDDSEWETRSDERSFRCMYCGKEFPSAQSLGGHLNGHKKEKVADEARKFLNMHTVFQKQLEKSVPEDSIKLLAMLQEQLGNEMRSTRSRSDAGASTTLAIQSPQRPKRSKKRDQRHVPENNPIRTQTPMMEEGLKPAPPRLYDESLERTALRAAASAYPITVDRELGADRPRGNAPEPAVFTNLAPVALSPAITSHDDGRQERRSAPSEPFQNRTREIDAEFGAQRMLYSNPAMQITAAAPFRAPFSMSPSQGTIVAPNYVLREPPAPTLATQQQQEQQRYQLQRRSWDAETVPGRYSGYPNMPIAIDPFTGQVLFYVQPLSTAPASMNITRREEESHLLRGERHHAVQMAEAIDLRQQQQRRRQQEQEQEKHSPGAQQH